MLFLYAKLRCRFDIPVLSARNYPKINISYPDVITKLNGGYVSFAEMMSKWKYDFYILPLNRDGQFQMRVSSVEGPLLGKIATGGFYEYLGLNSDNGLNKHIMTYGASGSGKSRGFVKPFILKTAQLRQSMIIVDPKAEMAEQMSEYLREQGYVVKMFNLLDMENSDGWNCLGEIDGDVDMVQSVAEVIIRNTSENGQKADFWDKAEKNLLVALIHYVCTLTDAVFADT